MYLRYDDGNDDGNDDDDDDDDGNDDGNDDDDDACTSDMMTMLTVCTSLLQFLLPYNLGIVILVLYNRLVQSFGLVTSQTKPDMPDFMNTATCV